MMLVALVTSLALLAANPSQAQIDNLRATREGQNLVVSFQLTNALDQPTLERIRSGLPTEFLYVLRLERPRRWWFDNNILRLRYAAVVKYNAVTEEYLVNFQRDGALVDSRVVTDEAQLERLMTRVTALSAFALEDLKPNRMILKVKAELGSRHFLLLFPRTIQTPWAVLEVDNPKGTARPRAG